MMRHTRRAISCDPQGELSLVNRPPLDTPQQANQPLALVRVEAFGLNRADLLQRAGHYPPPPGVSPEILGLEFTGVVEQIIGLKGEGSDDDLNTTFPRPQVGDRVMGICAGGAYAEELFTPLDQLLPVPDHFSVAQAAALPEAYLTAYDALINQASLRSGERVLIHAIGSGVGAAAAHLASLLGAEVIGTTRSEWKRERALRELPVSQVWLSKDGQWSPPDAESFDVIIDFVGAAYLKENVKRLALKGRLVVVGLLGGIKAELNLGLLLSRRAQLIGTVLRSRSTTEKIELTQRFRHEILPHFSNQVLAPPAICDTYLVSDSVLRVDDAHERLANNDTWSKLVCVWDV